MIEGFATSEGTENFARKSSAHKDNFRKIQDLTLANVGIGTYLAILMLTLISNKRMQSKNQSYTA